MKEEWLEANERVLGDWAVYIGEPSPHSPKVTGRLHVTDRRIVFAAGLELAANAGPDILRRRQAFSGSDQLQAIPFERVHAAETTRSKLILRSLLLTLKSGEQAEFQFGAASPERALKLIRERLGG